jgi:hypothetical protein
MVSKTGVIIHCPTLNRKIFANQPDKRSSISEERVWGCPE